MEHEHVTRWRNMLSRCENPKDGSYQHYGARGITVCERWHDRELFFEDLATLLGPCPDDYSLDRINNDGNYEPSNVRWASRIEQAQNKRQATRANLKPEGRKVTRPKKVQMIVRLTPHEREHVQAIADERQEAAAAVVRAAVQAYLSAHKPKREAS